MSTEELLERLDAVIRRETRKAARAAVRDAAASEPSRTLRFHLVKYD